MVQFIDDHRDVFGVEPICAVLTIAPSTYHRHRHQRTHPTRRSARAQRDDQLRVEIQRVYDEHQQVYGPRKVWKQLQREGVRVARCTVARLVRAMGLAGAVRGRAWITTTRRGWRIPAATWTPCFVRATCSTNPAPRRNGGKGCWLNSRGAGGRARSSCFPEITTP